jgi:hypothetical protein
MAIMRTNRLTSKTTPPKTVTTKNVTVSNVKPKKITPWAELEAQDAAYKKYQQDTEVYNKKSKKYNELTKDNATRDYMPVFGGEKNTRRLNAAETAEWNKKRSAEFGDEYLEEKDINVPTGNYKKLTDGGKTYSGDVSVHMSSYVKPTAPKRVDPPNWTTAELAPMKVKRPEKLVPQGKLKTKLPERAEPAQFEAPGVQKKSSVNKNTKTITKGALNSSRPGMAEKGQAKLKGARVTTTETNVNRKSRDMMGYNRQEKQFKAYAGTSVLGESHIGKSAQDLNAYKKEYKSQRKEYRKEGNAEGVAATSMEVKQARQAEKFVKGKQTHFNDENYRKTTGKTSRIAPDYRNSADNAANRNTMQAKLNAISAKPKNNTNMY